MATVEQEPQKPVLPTQLCRSIDCKQGAVRAVRFNVDGNYCMSCGSDKTLKLWNPHRGILIKTYMGHGYDVLDAQGSCDSAQLVSCGMDKAVMLWDVATGHVLRKYFGHVGRVNCVCFNEESTVALSGAIDGTVRCWDCRSKKADPIQTLDDALDSVTSIKVSDHEILASSADGCIRRYDLRMGQLFCDNIGTSVSCVSFTRDDQCVLVSCLDSTIKLMDKDTGGKLAEYTGHKNVDYRIDSCLSSTDEEVLSGSEDGCVHIWNLLKQHRVDLLVHPTTKVVHSLSYHPSKVILLTASEGKFHVWQDPAIADVDDAEDSS